MNPTPTDDLSRNTEAVADSLSTMIKKEFTSYSCCYDGYLDPSDPTMLTAAKRTQLVDWCYGVVDHCEFSRETVASAMEMVDRFLSIPNSTSDDAARVCDEALRDESKLQLLTVTALYVSIKLNQKTVISSEQFSSEVCYRVYSAKEIEDMERTLLSGLSWRCHAPTAYQVGLSILSLLLPYVDIPEAQWGFLMDEMTYLTELAVRDYYFSTQRASTIALAAILNVISDSNTKEPRRVLRAFLQVITESFDFEGSQQITSARSRLKLLSRPVTEAEGDEIVDDERSSVAESVLTLKTFNGSSHQTRHLEELNYVHGSPNSSLIDISFESRDSVCSFLC